MEYCKDCKYLLEDDKCEYWGEDIYGTEWCDEKIKSYDDSKDTTPWSGFTPPKQLM